VNRTLLPIRLIFVLVCAASGWLVAYATNEPYWDAHRWLAAGIGLLIGALTVLVDVLLKGFSLRGLSAITFGLAVGALISFLIGASPLLEQGDEQVKFLVRLALFVICAYLGTVIAMRGKDEFQLVIPYVRFVPHEVEVPLVVVDTSALIDGRIVKICESHFLVSALVIPQFVIDAMQMIADAPDSARQARGRKGLETLNQLRRMPHIDLRVIESDVGKGTTAEEKLVFIAQSMKARILTTDYNLAQRAQFHGVAWLNINSLAKALHQTVQAGEMLQIDIAKTGREPGQGVGFLSDGSMVVVDGGAAMIGKTVMVEVASIVPSAGGKMVFARPVERK
jgi:uncharacterized protein YacL